MLVLSRHEGERIRIGDDVIVTVVELRHGKVRLGIEAPKSVPVHREEIWQQLRPSEKLLQRDVLAEGREFLDAELEQRD